MISKPDGPARYEGWEFRLAEFVKAASERPFQYGSFDCCSMPCEAASKITGVDPWAHSRGRYKTERGAARVIRRAGGFIQMVEKIMSDYPEAPISFARRGDILLVVDAEIVESGSDAMLALCLGHDMGYVSRDRGFRLLPFNRASRAWRIG